MFGKRISIECGRLRAGYRAAGMRLFGTHTNLGNMRLGDLDDMRALEKHAEHCKDCASFLREVKKAMLVALDAAE